jgi:hypothetical protein
VTGGTLFLTGALEKSSLFANFELLRLAGVALRNASPLWVTPSRRLLQNFRRRYSSVALLGSPSQSIPAYPTPYFSFGESFA